MSEAEKPRPLWRLHIGSILLSLVTFTGLLAIDFPSGLFKSRPAPPPNTLLDLLVAGSAATLILVTTERTVRRYHLYMGRQIPLASFIVATVMLGLVLYLNMAPGRYDFACHPEIRDGERYEIWGKVFHLGFPATAYYKFEQTIVFGLHGKVQPNFIANTGDEFYDASFDWYSMVFNTAVGATATYIAVLCVEKIIRRREARKT